MGSQTVRLTVPADPAFARSVRMMAANVAVVGGMGIDAVEDVRMAAEEGFVYACATEPAACDVTFSVAEGSVAIDFSLGADEPDAERVRYARLLLAAVCDEFDFDVPSATLHLLRRAAS